MRSPTDAAAFEALLQGAGVATPGTAGWVGVAGGNLCGGSDTELAMLRSLSTTAFSIARGPAPYVVASGSPVAIDNWTGLAVGRLNSSDSYDKIVAVRHKTDSTGVTLILIMQPPGRISEVAAA